MKRYYIIRVNGIDWAITDNSAKVCEACEYLNRNCEECKTEINALTTTYNFTFKHEIN